MKIDAVPTLNDIRSDEFIHKTVIVIDVLRATSWIVTAFANGAHTVIPTETVSQAIHLQKEGDLLAGERFCKKISGFDLGNSPVELLNENIHDKRIILTTTNGTRAIHKCQKAQTILCASFLNAKSCARVATDLQRDIILVCAGTGDRFSLEDSLCAGRLVKEFKTIANTDEKYIYNDFAIAMHAAYEQLKNSIEETLKQSEHGKRLIKLGFDEDVSFCTKLNRYDLVPYLTEDGLRLFSSKFTDHS